MRNNGPSYTRGWNAQKRAGITPRDIKLVLRRREQQTYEEANARFGYIQFLAVTV